MVLVEEVVIFVEEFDVLFDELFDVLTEPLLEPVDQYAGSTLPPDVGLSVCGGVAITAGAITGGVGLAVVNDHVYGSAKSNPSTLDAVATEIVYRESYASGPPVFVSVSV